MLTHQRERLSIVLQTFYAPLIVGYIYAQDRDNMSVCLTGLVQSVIKTTMKGFTRKFLQ